MDLRTESLNFSTFQLFICLFLTADRPSPHGLFSGTYPRGLLLLLGSPGGEVLRSRGLRWRGRRRHRRFSSGLFAPRFAGVPRRSPFSVGRG